MEFQKINLLKPLIQAFCIVAHLIEGWVCIFIWDGIASISMAQYSNPAYLNNKPESQDKKSFKDS